MTEIVLNLSKTDARIIAHALNEIVNGVEISDNEYVARIGTDRPAVRALYDRSVDSFARAELFVLQRVLREVCFGDIDDFEFRPRLSEPRERVCDLLARLTDYLHLSWRPEHESPEIRLSALRDEECLALSQDDVRVIRSAFNEVCNGLSIPDAEYARRVGTDRGSVRALLHKSPAAFDRGDLLVLKKTLIEVCFEDEIGGFEFPARLRTDRRRVCDLLLRVTDFLETAESRVKTA